MVIPYWVCFCFWSQHGGVVLTLRVRLHVARGMAQGSRGTINTPKVGRWLTLGISACVSDSRVSQSAIDR